MEGFIEVLTGTLGGGKTLFGVEKLVDHLARGGTGYTNVEVYPEKIAEELRARGWVFDPSRLHVLVDVNVQDLHLHIQRGSAGNPVMVLWDEASFDIDAKEHMKLKKNFKALCIFARKLDLHMILVSQVFNDLDNQVRGKVQKLWVCRNLKHLTIAGLIPCPIPLLFRVCYNVGGFAKPQHDHTEILWQRSAAFGWYNSDALVGAQAAEFARIQMAVKGPLERFVDPTPRPSLKPYYLAALCASFFVSL